MLFKEISERQEKLEKIALEIAEIFKSNHLNYRESESVLSRVENILKNRSYLET